MERDRGSAEMSRNLCDIGKAVVKAPCRRGREQPQAASCGPGIGERLRDAWMAVGGGRFGGDFDSPAGGWELEFAELNKGLGRNVNRRPGGKRAEIALEISAREQRVNDCGIALVQFRFGEIHRAREAAKDLRVRQRLAERLRRFNLCRERQMKIACDNIVEF